MAKPNIRAQLDSASKAAFRMAATKQGTSETRLLQLLIGAFLRSNPGDGTPPAPSEIKNDRFTFRLSARMKDDLTRRAQEQGMSPGAYLTAMSRAHLSKKAYFTERELEVLRQSNNELTAIGRNINQIARALNRSIDNAHLTKSKELQQVVSLVKANRDLVRNLMIANLSGWGVEHGKEQY